MTSVVTHSGRPLDEDLSGSILDAAIRVLAREGYGGFSIAAVATEAGVHRPAIYRRWPSKVDLAVAAIQQLKPAPPDLDSGDVRTDLVHWLVDSACGSDQLYEIAVRLHNDLAAHSELSDAVQEQIALPRRRMLTAMLERAKAAGQLAADLDTELAIDLLNGILFAGKSRGTKATPAEVERYVDLALNGLRSPPAPGPARRGC
jgi:AcrR family transcriptional regulator